MDFETLENVKKIPNKAIDLVENKVDEIHTVVIKFDFNEPHSPFSCVQVIPGSISGLSSRSSFTSSIVVGVGVPSGIPISSVIV